MQGNNKNDNKNKNDIISTEGSINDENIDDDSIVEETETKEYQNGDKKVIEETTIVKKGGKIINKIEKTTTEEKEKKGSKKDIIERDNRAMTDPNGDKNSNQNNNNNNENKNSNQNNNNSGNNDSNQNNNTSDSNNSNVQVEDPTANKDGEIRKVFENIVGALDTPEMRKEFEELAKELHGTESKQNYLLSVQEFALGYEEAMNNPNKTPGLSDQEFAASQLNNMQNQFYKDMIVMMTNVHRKDDDFQKQFNAINKFHDHLTQKLKDAGAYMDQNKVDITPEEFQKALNKGFDQGKKNLSNQEQLDMNLAIREFFKENKNNLDPVKRQEKEKAEKEKEDKTKEADKATEISKDAKTGEVRVQDQNGRQFTLVPVSDDFLDDIEKFNKKTGLHLKAEDFNKAFQDIGANAAKLDPAMRAEVMAHAYSSLYIKSLTSAQYQNHQNALAGKSKLSPTDIQEAFDKLMDSADDEAKKNGIIKDEYSRNNPNTISAEVKYAANLRFSETPKERKEAERQYRKDKIIQKDGVMNNFRKEVINMNALQGTKFNSQKIIDYLGHQFSKEGKDVDSMRADFPKKYNEFLQEAFKNMTEKQTLNGKKSIANKAAEFDKFSQELENVCKHNGWMDINEPHKFMGGLDPDFIKNTQINQINKQPANTYEQAQKDIKKMNWTQLEAKFDRLVKSCPKMSKDAMDSAKVHEMANYLRALDEFHSSRTAIGRLFNHNDSSREKDLLDKTFGELENKGYTKKDVENLIKNPISKDVVAKRKQEELAKVEAFNKEAKNAIKRKNELQGEFNKIDNGVRKKVEVNECDTRKEIVSPDVTTKPKQKELEKNKDKEVVAPNTKK